MAYKLVTVGFKQLGPDYEKACKQSCLTQVHSERPKLYTIFAFLSAVGLNKGRMYVKEKSTTLNFTTPRAKVGITKV